MRSASIRTVQHQLASILAEVETGGEIVITRRGRAVARLSPVSPVAPSVPTSPAAVRAYWRKRPLPPAVQSSVTHAELVGEGRGDV